MQSKFALKQLIFISILWINLFFLGTALTCEPYPPKLDVRIDEVIVLAEFNLDNIFYNIEIMGYSNVTSYGRDTMVFHYDLIPNMDFDTITVENMLEDKKLIRTSYRCSNELRINEFAYDFEYGHLVANLTSSNKVKIKIKGYLSNTTKDIKNHYDTTKLEDKILVDSLISSDIPVPIFYQDPPFLFKLEIIYGEDVLAPKDYDPFLNVSAKKKYCNAFQNRVICISKDLKNEPIEPIQRIVGIDKVKHDFLVLKDQEYEKEVLLNLTKDSTIFSKVQTNQNKWSSLGTIASAIATIILVIITFFNFREQKLKNKIPIYQKIWQRVISNVYSTTHDANKIFDENYIVQRISIKNSVIFPLIPVFWDNMDFITYHKQLESEDKEFSNTLTDYIDQLKELNDLYLKFVTSHILSAVIDSLSKKNVKPDEMAYFNYLKFDARKNCYQYKIVLKENQNVEFFIKEDIIFNKKEYSELKSKIIQLKDLSQDIETQINEKTAQYEKKLGIGLNLEYRE